MHPHCFDALCAELAQPDYDGLSAAEAYAVLSDPETYMVRLGSLCFVTEDQEAAYQQIPKFAPLHRLVLANEVALQFVHPVTGVPTGLPGFPNLSPLKFPIDFAAAWAKVREGAS